MKKNIPDVGDKAPDFEVLTSENKNFKLSKILETGSRTLLVFYRGHW